MWIVALFASTPIGDVDGLQYVAAGLDSSEHFARYTLLTPEQLLDAAREAYARYDLGRARELIAKAASFGNQDHANAAQALRTLAEYDWKFELNANAARKHLDQALTLEPDSPETLVQRAGLAYESGDMASAAADVRAAIGMAGEPMVRADALVLQGQLVIVQIKEDEGATIVPLAAAISGVQEALRLQPGRSDAAETLVGLGVVGHMNDVVLEAVMAYHFLAEPEAAPSILQESIATLVELAQDLPRGQLSAAARRRQAIALGQARFYDWAAYAASKVPERDRELDALVAYQKFLEGVEHVNSDIYPQVARGLRDYEAAYDAAMADKARTLLEALGEPAPDPTESPMALFEHFMPYIAERFGAEGYFGTTVNFYGLLAGHTVIDERRQIEQYGFEGNFRFISLDRMISRDFTSWYGTTNVGGWGTESTIIQVRQAYLAAPYRQLAWVTDPAARSELEARIETLEASDLERCRTDPHAEPFAVVQRLRLEAGDRIRNRLAAQGLTGERLAISFIAEVLRLTTEATVFAHEGRHALDQLHRAETFTAMEDDERELRAKLSEIAFTEDPRFALTAIIGARLDESSGHGKANRRFRELIVHWMDEHRAEIADLEPDRPLIMQIDKLSPEQLRAFSRGTDRF